MVASIFAVKMCPRIRNDDHLYWVVCDSSEGKYAPGGGAANVLAFSADWPPWRSSYNNRTAYAEL